MSRKSSRRILVATLLVIVIGGILAALPPAPSFYVAEAQGRQTRTPRPTRTPNPAGSGGSGAIATSLSATANALKAKAGATLTAVANKFGPTLTALATRFDSADPEQAAQAIQTYAQTVLGTTVAIKKAGGFSGDITQLISQADSQAQSITATLATVNYAATLQNGAATLSYGAGTLSGDVAIDVQNASLGVYALKVAGSVPDANAALNLATATYPGLGGLAYAPYPTTEGYAWYVRTTVITIDPRTLKATQTAQSVLLYILPGAQGQVTVTATVGRGTYASSISLP